MTKYIVTIFIKKRVKKYLQLISNLITYNIFSVFCIFIIFSFSLTTPLGIKREASSSYHYFYIYVYYVNKADVVSIKNNIRELKYYNIGVKV